MEYSQKKEAGAAQIQYGVPISRRGAALGTAQDFSRTLLGLANNQPYGCLYIIGVSASHWSIMHRHYPPGINGLTSQVSYGFHLSLLDAAGATLYGSMRCAARRIPQQI
jgi:hypothetical protein